MLQPLVEKNMGLDSGYLYVLVNPSMPGLVKVGRTQRDSDGRAKELSAATGVPSPFILVYERHFENCTSAELAVHALLESQGFRPALNREFFDATPTVAINAILDVDHGLSGLPSAEPGGGYTTARISQGRALFLEARAAFLGENGRLVDVALAKKRFLQAAKLGAVEAYSHLANIAFLETKFTNQNLYGMDAYKFLKKSPAIFTSKLVPPLATGMSSGSSVCAWLLGSFFLSGSYSGWSADGILKMPFNVDSRWRPNSVEAEKCFVHVCERSGSSQVVSEDEALVLAFEVLSMYERLVVVSSTMTELATEDVQRYGKLRLKSLLAFNLDWAGLFPVIFQKLLRGAITASDLGKVEVLLKTNALEPLSIAISSTVRNWGERIELQ